MDLMIYILSFTGSFDLSNSTSPNVSPEVVEVFEFFMYMYITCAELHYILSTMSVMCCVDCECVQYSSE